MKIYYLQSEYQVGKHRVVCTIYDSEVFRFDEGVLSPFYVLNIDEVDPFNKFLCLDLIRTTNKTDINGEGKYYVDGLGQLVEKEGWQEYVPEVG